MDGNRKAGRNERSLVRVSSSVRSNVGLDENKVEVWPVSGSSKDRIEKSIMLTPFKAYRKDLDRVKRMVEDGDLTEEQASRVGFVTTNTFNKISLKEGDRESAWVSNGVEDTVIGTDPEFLLFDSDKVVKANEVLKKEGKLGSDGAMAEVRPDPSVSVEEHVENIRKVFESDPLVEKIKDFKWIASCYHKDGQRDYPVGGHVHVGNPRKLMETSVSDRQSLYKVLNKALDEFLAVPMIRFDGKSKGSLRRVGCSMGKYGWYGDMRTDLGRLEHRTLSGMWLLHPSLAKAVLGVAKAIIDSTFALADCNGFKSEYLTPRELKNVNLYDPTFDGWQNIPLAKDLGSISSSEKMSKIINESNSRAVNASYFNKWMASMRSLPCFEKYESYVEALAEMAKARPSVARGWNREIKDNWLTDKKFFVDF
jgi:hypothetical protein